MDRIKLFVIEDQAKILKHQLRILETEGSIEIVGSAMSGEDALTALEGVSPDVILCDLGLPRMSGLEITRAVKARWPTIEILIFTIFDEEEKVLEAVRAGAAGYLLKGAPIEKIVAAIRDVHAGGTVIQPNLARRLLRFFQPVVPQSTPPPDAPPVRDTIQPLTPREAEILELIAKGLSNSEAGRALGISATTIRTHLEHIYQKLEVSNRVEAVTAGIRKGLINM